MIYTLGLALSATGRVERLESTEKQSKALLKLLFSCDLLTQIETGYDSLINPILLLLC